MNRHIYNASITVGVLLTSVGVGLWNVAAGVATAGVLVLGFTIYAAELLSRSGKDN